MGKKILVVDDEPHIVKLIVTRLQANGYEVFTGTNGEEALEVARKERPDLILMDVLMPVMDGYTFVKTAKGDNDIKDIPVIILSAKDRMSELFKAEGIKDFLVKPCRAEELLKVVDAYLKPSSPDEFQ
ncbi:MAG: response regulator [bacterium]